MEGTVTDRVSFPEMFQRNKPMSFLGRRSFAPRPLSEATEIYDTDIEDDEDSPASLSTASTLSSYNELVTPPLSAGLGGFEFHFDDKAVAGPYGPHLFTNEQKYSDNIDVVMSMSPLPLTPKLPTRNITTLNTAVAELDEAQVRAWSPEDVADWMTEAGFESAVVDKFLMHDICGTVLLDLQFEDLKELDIASFGKRHQVMSSIQTLRNSALITSTAAPISRNNSHVSRTESRRRGRHPRNSTEDISPGESVSIVAIEQILPKPHKCHRGENCLKYRKTQRKIQRVEEQFVADMKSIAIPSIVASSDVLGPAQSPNITCERLSAVEPRHPLDNVRNFLDFQHVNSPTTDTFPEGDSPNTETASITPFHFVQNLNGLPKLTIPTQSKDSDSPWHTPISAFRNPTEKQAQLRAELQQDPYHYGGVASPVDVYRLGTPMSAIDLPVTALPVDPCPREVSHSVPPEMKYGSSAVIGESIVRSQTTTPLARRPRRPSYVPNMTALCEDLGSPGLPPVASEAELVNHSGWMRRRKTNRLMRHDWEDHYFTLAGTQLGVANEKHGESVESINVDDYTLHAYTTAPSSKLSSAFKKSFGTTPSEPSFAFSLIPEVHKTKKLFEKEKSHHFAVNSGDDRVEWMRKLMLAKALKKNDGQI